ncbi:chemotaxis protein CheW [Pelotomaculum terephthalicicum JT]|uniref:chemotaxis protein CheW n=1 Tax=Pelotomaculum TaxID=191373 RepID=UPI0009D1F7DE|nr:MULTISPECIES: chemotaxis protein CheW [Pelotomaculum]MCG9967680.1 chemotaxis protein CheW [Pelotomaculum terephthalicicum JT]OPX84026.1 MAG: Chemotaxis protein CheW [Pelotomaculum sp. PtaB.Bin117]OPY61488.1 MAG: Chemotaxis protein CheW [Pelotomaculum sp. PtaU1.Bin065]
MKKIVWNEIYNRLENARTAAERGLTPSHEEKKMILRARAKILAQAPKNKESTETHLKIVKFLLNGEKYAVDSAFIREVCSLKEITPLPCTPPFVLGIINVRGQILSVVDINKFFGIPGKGANVLNKTIIVHTSEMEFAIPAETITGVGYIARDEIPPLPPTLTNIRAEYLRGMTGEQFIVLDMARILSDKRIVVSEEA